MNRNKKTISAYRLIQRKTYNIRITPTLLLEIEKYCNENGIDQYLAAKIKIFVSIVLRKQITLDSIRGVRISRNFWVEVFGTTEYKLIKDHALKSGTVLKTGSYNPFMHLTSRYSIPEQYQNDQTIVYYPNLHKKALERFSKIELKRAKAIEEVGKHYGDNRATIQNQFLKDFSISIHDTDQQKILSQLYIMEGSDNKELNRNIILLNSILTGDAQVETIGKDGRLYNPFIYLGKELRKLLLIDFETLDISASHPFILSSILLFISNGHKRMIARKSGILNQVRSLESRLLNLEDHDLEDYDSKKKLLHEVITLLEYLVENLNKGFGKNISKEQETFFACKSIDSITLIREIELMNEKCRLGQFYEHIVFSLDEVYFDWRRLVNCTKIFDKVKKGIDPKRLKTGDFTIYEKKLFVKKAFMLFLNSKPKEIHKYPPKEIFHFVFPHLALLLDIIKTVFGHTIIRSLVALAESILVYGTINNLNTEYGINIGSIHDELVIPKNFPKDLVSELLGKESLKLFGMAPHIH